MESARGQLRQPEWPPHHAALLVTGQLRRELGRWTLHGGTAGPTGHRRYAGMRTVPGDILYHKAFKLVQAGQWRYSSMRIAPGYVYTDVQTFKIVLLTVPATGAGVNPVDASGNGGTPVCALYRSFGSLSFVPGYIP